MSSFSSPSSIVMFEGGGIALPWMMDKDIVSHIGDPTTHECCSLCLAKSSSWCLCLLSIPSRMPILFGWFSYCRVTSLCLSVGASPNSCHPLHCWLLRGIILMPVISAFLSSPTLSSCLCFYCHTIPLSSVSCCVKLVSTRASPGSCHALLSSFLSSFLHEDNDDNDDREPSNGISIVRFDCCILVASSASEAAAAPPPAY